MAGHGECPQCQPTGGTDMNGTPAVAGCAPLPIRELQINISPALDELWFPSGSLFPISGAVEGHQDAGANRNFSSLVFKGWAWNQRGGMFRASPPYVMGTEEGHGIFTVIIGSGSVLARASLAPGV